VAGRFPSRTEPRMPVTGFGFVARLQHLHDLWAR
jgi:hypothetical protein